MAATQIDLLLEAQRTINLRLTSIEIALAQLAERVSAHDQAAQKALRVLQGEVDALKQVVYHVTAPRRCSHCFCVVSACVTVCPVCAKLL